MFPRREGSSKINVTILGREIGTAEGWEEPDFLVMSFYRFQSSLSPSLHGSMITINFTTGVVDIHDDSTGEVTQTTILKLIGVEE